MDEQNRKFLRSITKIIADFLGGKITDPGVILLEDERQWKLVKITIKSHLKDLYYCY